MAQDPAYYEPRSNYYMEAKAGIRALQLDPEQALRGETLVSAETVVEESETSIAVFVAEHFGEFLKVLRNLSSSDQEMLLSYYVLNVPQKALGIFHQTTQTAASYLLRVGVKRFGAFLLMGVPSEERMRKILKRHKLDSVTLNLDSTMSTARRADIYKTMYGEEHCSAKTETFSLAELIVLYQQFRSFKAVAQTKKIYRPGIRKAIAKCGTALAEKRDPEALALAAYLHGLTHHANLHGTGRTPRQLAKEARVIHVKLPPCTSQFAIDVQDPNFDEMFYSKSETGYGLDQGNSFD
jgi:hypothetical protein